MLHIPTPTSDITGFFVVPLLVFERACGVRLVLLTLR